MDVRVAARIFHDWAFAEGFLSEAAATPGSNAADFAHITPQASDEAKQILRTKQVQMIGFDETAHEITVFTRRATPNKKQKTHYRSGSTMSQFVITKVFSTPSATPRR